MGTENGDHTASLTDEEREAFLTALETGYFAAPRHETPIDLADELDISDEEASKRLRCAMAKVFNEHRELLQRHLDEDDRFFPEE